MNELAKLKPFVKPYVSSFVIVFILGALMSLAATGAAAGIKYLFDEGFAKKDQELLLKISFGIVGLYIVHGIARFFHLYILKYTGEKISVQIQKDLQEKYMRLSLSFHSKSDTGTQISKAINDVHIIQWGLNILADCLREPVLALCLVSYAFWVDWKLTIFIFVIGPLIGGVLAKLGKSVRKYSHHQQETLEQFTSTLKETLDGLRIIQSFRLEEVMKSRLGRVITRYLHARKKIITRQESAGPISEVIAVSAFAGVAYYMGMQIINDQATVGGFVSYIAALGMLQAPIKKLQDAFIRLQQTVVSLKRITMILENDNVISEPSNPETFPQNWKDINFKSVTFAYESQPILKDINLNVKRGEIIALVGTSGSGKSTLVNLLERFFDPTSGTVNIGGIDIKSLKLSDLRSHVALVTQDVFLFNSTIEDNIRAGSKKNNGIPVEEAAKLANAYDFIMKKPKGFKEPVGDRGGLLSGGEKQRISIARAIYKNAEILILDEATSALDSTSEIEVQKGLDRLMEGKTVFVIAHRLSTVMNANRILVLSNGRVVEEGNHKALVDKKGAYYEFYTHQIV